MRPPTKRATRAVFWDIDGTLLVTGRAGMIAWERAFAAESGAAPFPAVRPDGLTDHQIGAWLLGEGASDAVPGEAAQARVARLVARYEAELSAALPLRQGRVLDNVIAVLESIGRRDELLSWLVTGNTRAGALAKLRYYGLSGYFEVAGIEPGEDGDDAVVLAGAFSESVEPRSLIVRRALHRARATRPDLEPDEMLVVGDTPHDIEGAHAQGIPVLAVATNVHSEDELAVHRPWRIARVLPDASQFASLLAST